MLDAIKGLDEYLVRPYREEGEDVQTMSQAAYLATVLNIVESSLQPKERNAN